MEEELKTIFDEIKKMVAEEEDNAIAKAFTMYIEDLLNRNGIKPILTKVEAPYEECSNKNEYHLVSRYGYIFERLDTSEHDKRIRDEVIDEFVEMLKNEWTIDSILCATDKYRLIAIFKRIAEQMKGKQNE